MKHIVCFSGGHSSGIVAIEVVKKFGKENVILLNHNITEKVEAADVQRFKEDIANYLDMKITYANMKGWENKDQFDVAIKAKAFKTPSIPAVCTNRMKTKPFYEWLKENIPNDKKNKYIIYYGFDENEQNRIKRRRKIMTEMGYKTDYPLALWKDRTIDDVNEINIERPLQYDNFKHANCIGCLKGGKQHWYVVYCTRKDIFEKAKETEDIIGFSILKEKKKPIFLKDLECTFDKMKRLGVKPTEHIPHQRFWAEVAKLLKEPTLENYDEFTKPCLCTT